mmetsp:Transcript_170265/g.546088  ORF Transcript_170265/g.546088 Transcript_170265/m.546088 type:complete len:164 (+) Transcript_170265:56-547(+)
MSSIAVGQASASEEVQPPPLSRIDESPPEPPKEEAPPVKEAPEPPAREELPKEEVPPKEGPKTVPPSEFLVTVKKIEGNMKIGLDTVARSSPTIGCALRVQKVKDGLVNKWNANNPDKQVREGDHICEVNGEKTDTEKMYGVIAESWELTLLIKREWPPPNGR